MKNIKLLKESFQQFLEQEGTSSLLQKIEEVLKKLKPIVNALHSMNYIDSYQKRDMDNKRELEREAAPIKSELQKLKEQLPFEAIPQLAKLYKEILYADHSITEETLRKALEEEFKKREYDKEYQNSPRKATQKMTTLEASNLFVKTMKASPNAATQTVSLKELESVIKQVLPSEVKITDEKSQAHFDEAVSYIMHFAKITFMTYRRLSAGLYKGMNTSQVYDAYRDGLFTLAGWKLDSASDTWK